MQKSSMKFYQTEFNSTLKGSIPWSSGIYSRYKDNSTCKINQCETPQVQMIKINNHLHQYRKNNSQNSTPFYEKNKKKNKHPQSTIGIEVHLLPQRKKGCIWQANN